MLAWRTRFGSAFHTHAAAIGTALKLAAGCSRRAALVVVDPCPMGRHGVGKSPLSFGARPWCHVPAAASNAKPAPRVSCSARAPALAVSEEAQHSSLLCARAMPPWLWSARTLSKVTAPARAFPLSARARGAACQLQPPTPSQRCISPAAQARCAHCLWGKGAALELAGRTRHTAPVVVGPYDKKRHCSGERPPSFSARPWCNVPATVSNAKRAPHVSRSAGALCSLSLGRRCSTRACCARAPCRAGCGRPVRLKKIMRRREAPLFQRAPVVQRTSYSTQHQASAAFLPQRRRAVLTVSGEEAQHSSFLLRARRTALVVIGPYA